MKTYLKIKIKSLAAEAIIIRSEERKWIKPDGRRDHPLRLGLQAHRKHEVRSEARVALIAYGFLRGRPYERIEQKTHSAPDWKRVQQLIEKYGSGDRRVLVQQFAAWKDAQGAK